MARKDKIIGVLVAHPVPYNAYNAGIISGLATFAQARKDWRLCYGLTSKDLNATLELKPAGLIAMMTNLDGVNQILADVKIPVVSVLNALDTPHFPRVGVDERHAGRQAANYFCRMRLNNFACFPGTSENYAMELLAGYREALEEKGHTLHVHEPGQKRRRGELPDQHIERWLASLPKPVAVLASDDSRAYRVLKACQRMGLQIPREVQILGVGNDSAFGQACQPTLSSIPLPLSDVGYRAAKLLDRMIKGGKPPKHPILLKPLPLVARGSTALSVQGNHLLDVTLNFINLNYGACINVSDVVRATSVSRRSLEYLFREHLGRTINDEIQRCRIENAKRLLMDTDLSMSNIADAVGVSSSRYLADLFRKREKISPSEFRERYRDGKS